MSKPTLAIAQMCKIITIMFKKPTFGVKNQVFSIFINIININNTYKNQDQITPVSSKPWGWHT